MSKEEVKTVTYIRPSGRPLEVADNEANHAHAKEQGWKLKGADKAPPKDEKK